MAIEKSDTHNTLSITGLNNHGQAAPKRPFPEDDVASANMYSVAQEVERILLRMPISDHIAILGIIQVTTQKRASDHQTRQQAKMQAAQEEAQRRAQFGVTQ